MADRDPIDAFTGHTEAEFDRYINEPDHTNRGRITNQKRHTCRYWLLNPLEKPSLGITANEKQRQYNEKNKALRLFKL